MNESITDLCLESRDAQALSALRRLLPDQGGVGDKREICRRALPGCGQIQPPDTPDYFLDAISLEIMDDPFTIGPHSFDRSTVEMLQDGLSKQYQNPLTRDWYTHVYPNIALREAIEAWKSHSGFFLPRDDKDDKQPEENKDDQVKKPVVWEDIPHVPTGVLRRWNRVPFVGSPDGQMRVYTRKTTPGKYDLCVHWVRPRVVGG
jgi:hypothetical protein